jgi:hypothetical protein
MFPFSFGIDQDLKIRYIGSAFCKIFDSFIIGQNLFKVFNLNRPTLKIDWNSVIKFQIMFVSLELFYYI